MVAEAQNNHNFTPIFTYGTLKQGFSNHGLLQDMMAKGDAVYKGTYQTIKRYPLVCGPYRVPFMLNLQGSGQQVCGELYDVSPSGLARLDELEGTTKGHYERLPCEVVIVEGVNKGEGEGVVCAEAYYGHRSYAEELWRRNGEVGFGTFTEKEARGYVRRKDRPAHLTFLEQIWAFVSGLD